MGREVRAIDLVALGKDLLTQDNLCTHEPIFMVQQRNRVYGFDPIYTDDHIVWIDSDACEYSKEKRDKLLEEMRADWREEGKGADDIEFLDEDSDEFLERFALTRTAYQDFWENIQPFFSRAGAEEYIAANAHNLKHPRVYVESAYRNAEWQAMRKMLMDLGLQALAREAAQDKVET